MNRIFNFFLLVITAFAVACSGTQSSSTAEQEHSEPMHQEEEVAAAASDLYSVAVLVDTIASPRKEMTAAVDGVNVTVNYGSPSVKGRPVWGDLVPFAEVWRAGANEATRITFDKDVMIGGQALAAGTYGFFTIPGEDDWTLIFNSEAEQWGAYKYAEDKDVLRVKVMPEATEAMSETMEFKVMEGNVVALTWEKLVVPFAVSAG